MPLLLAGIDVVAGELSAEGGDRAAGAIMTTDTVPQTGSSSKATGGVSVRWPKGGRDAGTVARHDARRAHDRRGRDAATLDASLRAAIPGHLRPGRRRRLHQYERHPSCCSRAARRASSPALSAGCWLEAVAEACHSLALQMISDAEGRVEAGHDRGRRRRERRRRTRGRAGDRSGHARKCALAGSDPNWGRVVAALGMDVSRVRTREGRRRDERRAGLFRGGPLPTAANADLRPRDVLITVDLHEGDAHAWVWTTDLTQSYVELNSEYTT